MGRGGEDGLDPDIDRVDWTWRWDEEWISTHTSSGYVYGFGYANDEEDYGTDVTFLSTSSMSDAEEDVDVSSYTSISSYMEIDVDEDGLCADLTATAAFGCPIILTCSLYDYDDYADTPYEVEIRLGYDSVLGSLGTLEDWIEVTSERELEDALETSCNIKLEADIECSVEISHRTHLDLNGHTLSGEADVSKRARIENGKITSNGDGIIAEGDEKIEITDVELTATGNGVTADADVEISNCSISGTSGVYMTGGSVTVAGDETIVQGSQYGAYVGGGSFSLSSGEIRAESSSTGVYGIYLTNSGSAEVKGKVSVSSDSGTAYGIYAGNSSRAVVSGGEVKAETDSGNVYGVNVSSSSIDISGGKIAAESNSGVARGAAVSGESSSLTMSAGEVSAYSETYVARGMLVQNTGSLTVTGGTVSAEGGDNGQAVRAEGGTAAFSDCVISGKGDTSYGVYNIGVEMTLTYCTISAASYGVYNSGSSVSTTISGGTVSGDYGVYASSSGGSVTATSCEIKSEATDTDTHAAVYSASSASITVNGGSVKGSVGAWAYTGNVTLENVSVTSTAGDGLKAYQGCSGKAIL